MVCTSGIPRPKLIDGISQDVEIMAFILSKIVRVFQISAPLTNITFGIHSKIVVALQSLHIPGYDFVNVLLERGCLPLCINNRKHRTVQFLRTTSRFVEYEVMDVHGGLGPARGVHDHHGRAAHEHGVLSRSSGGVGAGPQTGVEGVVQAAHVILREGHPLL